jgi:hypothetical protein
MWSSPVTKQRAALAEERLAELKGMLADMQRDRDAIDLSFAFHVEIVIGAGESDYAATAAAKPYRVSRHGRAFGAEGDAPDRR